MYRYNMIVEDAGIKIMPTERYINSVAMDPGHNHLNMGDFYSEIHVLDIAKKVYDSLKALDDEDLFLMEESEFRKSEPDPEGTYVLSGFGCSRVYCPGVKDNKENAYMLLSLCFIEKIVTGKKKGSIQKGIDEIRKPLEEVIRELS